MNYITTIILGMLSGFMGCFIYMNTINPQFIKPSYNESNADIITTKNKKTVTKDESDDTAQAKAYNQIPQNFELASNNATQSVVFIQTLNKYRSGSLFDWFFEPRTSKRVGSGSGVIFSQDGYIVTNNHVIEDADQIKVILGKNSYDATLVGADPSSDLALIKIEDQNLKKITLGSSQEVEVGQWVLAVGNPFNLTSTVTAGIVSAKGRNINLLREKFPIESFIQTDAAINPGNSGGALVNIKGELIGINTAILSQTGSYAGYGFAVPVDIVKKVVNDLIKYGEVQKAFIGADFIDIDSEIAEKLNIESTEGVLVTYIQRNGSADKAGINKGDILLSLNGKKLKNKTDLEELLAYKYPGENIELIVKRNGKRLTKKVTLTNKEGTTGIITKSVVKSESLGVTFESVPKVEKDLLGINSGIEVKDIESYGFFSRLDIPEGFIITEINNNQVETPEELIKILENIKGRVIISGVDRKGRKLFYPYIF